MALKIIKGVLGIILTIMLIYAIIELMGWQDKPAVKTANEMYENFVGGVKEATSNPSSKDDSILEFLKSKLTYYKNEYLMPSMAVIGILTTLYWSCKIIYYIISWKTQNVNPHTNIN